jgi:hypothetical protein
VVEDDLPEIKRSIQKGFADTQKTVNKWITDFKKKMDGEEEEDLYSERPGGSQDRQNFGSSQHDQLYGIRKSSERGRRSGDRERYDADPHILSDDFTALQMQDNESKFFQCLDHR